MKDNRNILSCLLTFFVHGDFKNLPEDFDVFDEIEKRNGPDKTDKSTGRTSSGDIKLSTGADVPPPTQEIEDPLLDKAYWTDDELLKLLRDTLRDIKKFEMELDNSFEQLENKFDKKEYQYDTTST